MSETVTIVKLIAALRETAAKATEHVIVPPPAGGIIGANWEPDRRDKYSREWIAGRLLGMADTLEAMTEPEAATPAKSP